MTEPSSPANSKPPLVVSLDDEWLPQGRSDVAQLQAIYAQIERFAKDEGLVVAYCATLKDFAQCLVQAHQEQRPVPLIVIDAMLNSEPQSTFADIGRSDEKVLRIEAGIQLVAHLLDPDLTDEAHQNWQWALDKSQFIILTTSGNCQAVMFDMGLYEKPQVHHLNKDQLTAQADALRLELVARWNLSRSSANNTGG